MNIDIVSQICVYNDNPIFRQLIQRHRNKFNKVILYASRHHGVIDLEEFWRRVFPETWVSTEIDWTKPGVDWRQEETIPLIEKSDSEWILFMEADFFVDDWDKLWRDVEKAMQDADMIGWYDNNVPFYIHPCFLLIKRELLEKTQKDFRAHPEIEGSDHFAQITKDVEKMGKTIIKLQDLGWKAWENAFHLGGLTYPYQNWKGDGTDHFGVKSPEAFAVYNYWSRKAPVEQHPIYEVLSMDIGKRLKELFPDLDLENNKWTKFFCI